MQAFAAFQTIEYIGIAFKGHQISSYARSDQKYIYSSTLAKPLDRESANPMLPDSGFSQCA
jgi:hypothetical protein